MSRLVALGRAYSRQKNEIFNVMHSKSQFCFLRSGILGYAAMVTAKLTYVLLLLLLVSPARAQAPSTSKVSPWEPEISAFEQADRTNPPPRHPILFVGSSSIRLWKTLAQDLKGYPVLNHGFGGSQISDSTAFCNRIITPYEPSLIFLYAGDNDVAADHTPDQILRDFKEFVAAVRAKLPSTPIAFISIKPSPSRWQYIDTIKAANRLISEYVRSDKRLTYVDIFSKMLDAEAKPREELFIADKLHMNAQGYAIWTEAIKAQLPPPKR